MSRQINLYYKAFRPQPKLFSAIWTAAGFLAVVAIMLAYYAWASLQLQEMRTRRNEAQVQVKQLRDQLVGLGQSAQKTRSKALENQVARAEVLLKSRQELIGRLKSGEIANRDGYSKFLVALARQRVEGVWLTRIEISGSRDDFGIQGRAVRADLVSEYIRMLRKEQAFRGKPIGTLALREREIDPGGEQKAPAGSAEPAGGAAQAQAGPRGPRPGVRVVEFTIGTGLAGGAEATHR